MHTAAAPAGTTSFLRARSDGDDFPGESFACTHGSKWAMDDDGGGGGSTQCWNCVNKPNFLCFDSDPNSSGREAMYTANQIYVHHLYMVKSAIWSIILWSQVHWGPM